MAALERDKKEGMDHLKANLVCNFTPWAPAAGGKRCSNYLKQRRPCHFPGLCVQGFQEQTKTLSGSRGSWRKGRRHCGNEGNSGLTAKITESRHKKSKPVPLFPGTVGVQPGLRETFS